MALMDMSNDIIESQEKRAMKLRHRLSQIPLELSALILPEDQHTKAYDRVFSRRIKLHRERIMLWQKLGMMW